MTLNDSMEAIDTLSWGLYIPSIDVPFCAQNAIIGIGPTFHACFS